MKEHAFFISDPIHLKYFYNSKFDRIYFGNEFHEENLPTLLELQKMIQFCEANNISFTFVTPYIIDKDKSHLKDLLTHLDINTEVVINNEEILNLKIKKKFIYLCGRLLSDFHLQYKKDFITKLDDYNINRIEIDNKSENHKFLNNICISKSLYYPYVQDYFIKYQIEYHINNNYKKSKKYNIDRLVYMPVFPYKNTHSEKSFYLNWNIPYLTDEKNLEWKKDTFEDVFKKLIKQINLKLQIKVFDIGCGDGRNYKLFQNYNVDYHGIDISEKAIEICRKKIKPGNFYNNNFSNFDVINSDYDLLFDYGCFHSIPPYQRKKYINKVYKLLKNQNGYLFLGTWYTDDISNTPTYFSYNQLPEWGFNPESIKNIFSNKFSIINYEIKKIDHCYSFIYFLLKKV